MNTRPTIVEAILSLAPGAGFAIMDDGSLFWGCELPQPTDSEIEAKLSSLVAEYDAQDYARKRAAEYPRIDQLIIALWESSVEGRPASVTELQALREAIKQKYPKPS